MKLLPRRTPKATTAEERHALCGALDRLRADWGFASSFTLETLLKRWSSFVQEVEGGFEGRLHDYTYELSLRDELDSIVKCVPERLAEEIRQYLDPLDHRYRFATVAAPAPIAPAVAGPDRYWWSRIPKRLENELRGDLIMDGILPS